MSYLNQVNLIGNLGKDPEVLISSEKGDFVKLSIAITKRYKNKLGEKVEDTQWHVVYLNNRLGSIGAMFLHKGDRIFISGELRTREWIDDEGIRHFSTSVYARDLRFLSTKSRDKNGNKLSQSDDQLLAC